MEDARELLTACWGSWRVCLYSLLPHSTVYYGGSTAPRYICSRSSYLRFLLLCKGVGIPATLCLPRRRRECALGEFCRSISLIPLPLQSSLHNPLFPPSIPNKTETDFRPLGVKSYDVSLDTQTAIVVTESSLSYDKVLATIAKTGKKVNTGEADGEVKSVEVVAA